MTWSTRLLLEPKGGLNPIISVQIKTGGYTEIWVAGLSRDLDEANVNKEIP
ncbi:MAG: hypothetical protein IBV52_02110 [Candidatus Bathyarchaeota archaeon]